MWNPYRSFETNDSDEVKIARDREREKTKRLRLDHQREWWLETGKVWGMVLMVGFSLVGLFGLWTEYEEFQRLHPTAQEIENSRCHDTWHIAAYAANTEYACPSSEQVGKTLPNGFQFCECPHPGKAGIQDGGAE